jgi:hypothetical protein
MDYSEALLEIKKITQEIHLATLSKNFELAQQLADSLSFATEQLFDALGVQIERN